VTSSFSRILPHAVNYLVVAYKLITLLSMDDMGESKYHMGKKMEIKSRETWREERKPVLTWTSSILNLVFQSGGLCPSCVSA
jgi:hypothetical protein